MEMGGNSSRAGWMTTSVYLLRYTFSKMDTMRPEAIQGGWKTTLADEESLTGPVLAKHRTRKRFVDCGRSYPQL